MTLKKGGWLRFSIGSLLGVGVIYAGIATFTANYAFGYDPQVGRLSTPFTWFLIHKEPFTPKLHQYVAFQPDDRHLPWFHPSSKMVKQIAGLPGDVVSLEGSKVLVNGQVVAERNPRILTKVNDKRPGYPLAFSDAVTIPQGFYLLINESKDSFDSRYWGLAAETALVGYVTPLI